MANKPTDYKMIKLWGEMMQSFPYYIHSQQEMAALDEAPLDAIYYSAEDKRWHTFGEITNPETIHYFAVRGIKQEPKP